jgi:hypothetical protein
MSDTAKSWCSLLGWDSVMKTLHALSGLLDISSGSQNGALLVVTAKALTLGMATVRAEFSQQCSSGDSTPCTIPSQGTLQLPITVVN